MSVKAILKLNKTKLYFQQTTRCYTELQNDSDETLNYINPTNWRGKATISLTNLETDEKSFHSQMILPEMEQPNLSLTVGNKLKDEFRLSNIIQFPSCGIFELQSHYEWQDGKTESEPVRVEILASYPQSLFTETSRGSQIGDIYCLWTNRSEDKKSIHFAKIDSSYEHKFIWSHKVAEIDEITTSSISIPANTIPSHQYIAWISESKLKYVIHNEEKFQGHSIKLDEGKYKIIPPILEDPFVEGVTQRAEIVLVKKNVDSWQLLLLVLDDSHLLSKSENISGVSPKWTKTAYRKDGVRHTFFIFDENNEVKLSSSSWKLRQNPPTPKLIKTWQGNFLAADQNLSNNNNIFGVALLKKNKNKLRYVIKKWGVNNENQLNSIQEIPLNLEEKLSIENAIIRINGEGTPFVSFKIKDENNWFWIDKTGEISSLSKLLPERSLPMDIIFIDEIYPAILFSDPICGLKIRYLGPQKAYRPPTGAW